MDAVCIRMNRPRFHQVVFNGLFAPKLVGVGKPRLYLDIPAQRAHSTTDGTGLNIVHGDAGAASMQG